TGEGEREEHERGDAEREQNQFAEVAPLGVLHRRFLQQLHRGELDARFGFALQQVQHDRNGGSSRAGEKERREKAHNALDRVERYESSASSSGRFVSSSW